MPQHAHGVDWPVSDYAAVLAAVAAASDGDVISLTKDFAASGAYIATANLAPTDKLLTFALAPGVASAKIDFGADYFWKWSITGKRGSIRIMPGITIDCQRGGPVWGNPQADADGAIVLEAGAGSDLDILVDGVTVEGNNKVDRCVRVYSPGVPNPGIVRFVGNNLTLKNSLDDNFGIAQDSSSTSRRASGILTDCLFSGSVFGRPAGAHYYATLEIVRPTTSGHKFGGFGPGIHSVMTIKNGDITIPSQMCSGGFDGAAINGNNRPFVSAAMECSTGGTLIHEDCAINNAWESGGHNRLVAAAQSNLKSGTLSTRTDDTNGVVALSAGHGLVTGDLLNVQWTASSLGGNRTNAVATVSGNNITITGGTGDNLPAQGSTVSIGRVSDAALIIFRRCNITQQKGGGSFLANGDGKIVLEDTKLFVTGDPRVRSESGETSYGSGTYTYGDNAQINNASGNIEWSRSAIDQQGATDRSGTNAYAIIDNGGRLTVEGGYLIRHNFATQQIGAIIRAGTNVGLSHVRGLTMIGRFGSTAVNDAINQTVANVQINVEGCIVSHWNNGENNVTSYPGAGYNAFERMVNKNVPASAGITGTKATDKPASNATNASASVVFANETYGTIDPRLDRDNGTDPLNLNVGFACKKMETFALTLAPVGGGTVTRDPPYGGPFGPGDDAGGFNDPNTEIVLTATPLPGFQFAGWYSAELTIDPDENPTTVQAVNDGTVYALFSPLAGTIGVSRVAGGGIEHVEYTPVVDIPAGTVVVQGELVGLATHAIPNNEVGALAVSGIFDIPKGSGEITAGALIYWDVSAQQATTNANSGANKRIGKTIAAAQSDDAMVRVRVSQ